VEVAVVGGGVIGTAAAYWLARTGAETLLLEARLPAWGASGRNAGLVLGAPASLELVRGVMADEGIDAGWHEPGHLALASSAAVLERFRAELAARPPGAAPLEVLDLEACRALLGTRISPRFHGGRWMPRAGALHPVRFVQGLATAAARHGATVAAGTAVLSLSPAARGGGWAVRTARRTVRARQVVLACNARGARLLPALAAVLSASRGQMLATRPLPPRFGPAMAVDYGAVYWRQLGDGSVLIGGCREADPGAERSGRAAVNPRVQAALERFLPDAFPDLGPLSVGRRWAGIMDATPDGRPLVGAWPGMPGVWIAAGFGGHGIPPALGAGQALARALAEGAAPPELAPLDPARFAEARC
jgi:glycine/D-amino acid oxidase-like deaminating enzyme